MECAKLRAGAEEGIKPLGSERFKFGEQGTPWYLGMIWLAWYTNLLGVSQIVVCYLRKPTMQADLGQM